MEERSELSVVIDGKVYRLSGGSDIYLQKLASYVDGKIRELKKQPGYNKLSTEYRDILLALNITEELFKLRDEIEVFNQDGRDRAQELYEFKQQKPAGITCSGRFFRAFKSGCCSGSRCDLYGW